MVTEAGMERSLIMVNDCVDTQWVDLELMISSPVNISLIREAFGKSAFGRITHNDLRRSLEVIDTSETENYGNLEGE
jgi:hypothetical protein